MTLIVTAGLLVAGCASYQWVRPDATAEVAATDERLCRAEARNVVYDVAVSPWAPPLGWGTWDGPWRRPGFGPWPDPSWQLAAEQRVLDRCMRAHGYDLVRVDKPR
jgi:hypothetical protein